MIQCKKKKKKKEGLRANVKLHLMLKMTPMKQVAKNPADLNHMPFQADGSHPILQNLNSSKCFSFRSTAIQEYQKNAKRRRTR